MYRMRPEGCVVKRNLRTTDDWLIRIGYLILAGSLLSSSCSDTFDSQGVGVIGPLLVFAAAVVTLTVGYSLRRDERRITQVWNILEHSAEVHIDELSHATGFSKKFLLRAVRMINGQPDTYYVWDSVAGTIVDGRMRSRIHIVEQCESCGAKVDAEVPFDASVIPTCGHCGGPVKAGAISALKKEMLEALRHKSLRPQRPFSVLLFIFLLLVFWPVAIVYAVWTSGAIDGLLSRW